MVEGQHRGSFRYATTIAISVVALALVGCGALMLLPQHGETISHLKTPNDLASAFARVQPGETRASQLSSLGFDTTTPNVHVLSYLGLIERYMTGDSRKFDKLDIALQDCIESRDRCTGFVFRPDDQPAVHHGVLATFGLSSANAAEPGAEAIIIVRNGRVAYKAISGLPASAASRLATQTPRPAIAAEPAAYRSVE
jgi:hypothetical protein